jgi:hypothetical protein
MGYTEQDLLDGAAGVGSNIGEGCGNPMTFAALMPGETVLDLGSGAGSVILFFNMYFGFLPL